MECGMLSDNAISDIMDLLAEMEAKYVEKATSEVQQKPMA